MNKKSIQITILKAFKLVGTQQNISGLSLPMMDFEHKIMQKLLQKHGN